MASTTPLPKVKTTSEQPRPASHGLISSRVTLSWKPYIQLARLHVAIPILLVFWPAAWGLTAAAIRSQMPFTLYSLQLLRFIAWSILCRSASCVWNDICDRHLDAYVERTKDRPLPAGATSVKAALIFSLAQAFATMLLMWSTNSLTIKLHVAAGIILNGPYPFMKRLTNWPQAFLGIAINCGIAIAWSSVIKSDWNLMMMLYAAAWSWTVYYDTCYAMMDRKDDMKAGINSTAVLFGNGSSARFVLSLFATGTVAGLLCFGIYSHQRLPYFILTVLGTALHLWWQISTVDFYNVKSCLKLFLSNATQLGTIIWSGLFVNYVLSIPEVQMGLARIYAAYI